MKTGQIAGEAGVNVQTLRYYERRGLLPEPPRRDSGYREYGSDAIAVVRFIKRAQELGFTLAEVEALLELADGGPSNCDVAREIAQEKIGELERKMANLQAMHDSLERLVATCELPRRRRECPLIDSLGQD